MSPTPVKQTELSNALENGVVQPKQLKGTPSTYDSGDEPSPPSTTGLKVAIGVLSVLTIAFFAWALFLEMVVTNSQRDFPDDEFGAKIDTGANPCAGAKPKAGTGFDNQKCTEAAIREQAGADVTKGFVGTKATTAVPITTNLAAKGLCPVNVHWHLGAEHRSAGQYDETTGKGPTSIKSRRLAAGKTRSGFQCGLYDKKDKKFTKKYNWKFCKNMEIGQTYEIHWPHSAVGACGTVNQFQSPFYDGVFCNLPGGTGLAAAVDPNGTPPDIAKLSGAVGVEAQVFTVVNDESYYYPNLMQGMIIGGEYGKDMAYYTGSTTGDTRSNSMCSSYTPITWQVDRKCHLISASTFDKMCADMLSQKDDMSDDIHPHGSRELVSKALSSAQHV